MGTPFSKVELAALIAGYQRAYGDRVEILPDRAEVVVDPGQPESRQTLLRDSEVLFVRDGQPPRAGILRLALLVDGQAFAVILVDDSSGKKQFRIAVADVTFGPSDQS